MSYQTIDFAIDGAVARIWLNRPERMNAMNLDMHAELADALGRIEADDAVRCVWLSGRGRAFCSGQDLRDRLVAPDAPPLDLGAGLERTYNALVRRLRRLQQPVVCAVNGVAAGAGCNLVLACDIVLAARSARFIEAFARIGLIPDAGGTWFLPRLVGRARALGMALTAEPVDAERAEQWGLIWRAVDDDALEAESMALATRLAAGPTRAFGLIKRAIDAAGGNGLDQQLDLERELQRIAGSSEDFREGVRAFIDKRDAVFRGR